MPRPGLTLFPSLRAVTPALARQDVLAGLTVWAVLAPESLAYASIAGVSPVVGLYAAPGALLLYAAFGSSRHLIVGPMSATAALSGAAIAELATPGSEPFLVLTVALAIATGLAALVAGTLRLGFVAGFISEPVLKGFIIGLALTILVGQLPHLFGVEGGGHNFFTKLGELVRHLDDTHGTTLLVGIVSLAVVLGVRELAPRLPGSLIAVAGGIAAARLVDLGGRGVELVGNVEAGLPELGLPDASLGDYLDVAPAAAAIMLISFAEGLAAAKTYAARYHYRVDADRELLAIGASNLAAGISGGMVVGGSVSKTAVNVAAGGRTQIAALSAAACTVATLVFLTGLFEDLPEATLAAVVIAAVIELVDVASLRRLFRLGTGSLAGVASRPDFAGAMAALVGVLVFDTLPGLFIGIVVSLLLLVYRASRPPITELGRVAGTAETYADIRRFPDNETVAGVVVLRVEGGLFFANAEAVAERIRQEAAREGVHAIVVDGETSPFIDVTAIRMLDELADELEREEVALVLAREVGGVRDLIARAEGAVTIYPTVGAAVDAVRDGG